MESVKGYRLCYSSLFEPVFQRIVNHASFQALEYLTCVGSATQFVGFVADGECCFRLGFLCSDIQTIALVGSNGKIFPLKIENIANA